MSAQAPASTSKSWIRTTMIYLSAALFSATLLPATLAGWYFADRASLASAIGTAIDYAVPVR